MPTRTRHREWTRPAGGDPARIEDSVGTPLDEIDVDVQEIHDRVTDHALAHGAFVATMDSYTAPVDVARPIIPPVELLDVSGAYDVATGRYTPGVAGYYWVSFYAAAMSAISRVAVGLSMNGRGITSRIVGPGAAGSELPIVLDRLVRVNNRTDYLHLSAVCFSADVRLEDISIQAFLVGRI